MANISFNVDDTLKPSKKVEYASMQAQLIKKAFGYETVEVKETPDTELDPVGNDMKEGKAALLGHPLFMPLILQKTSYDVLVNGQVKKNGVTVPKMFFPIVLIEASRSKVIEVTTIEGRNGTIKEFSNLGDYEISIKGILVGDEGGYPTEQVKGLARFENCPVSIGVANDFLKYIGVAKLVIKRINWRNMQGYENLQAFELECMSDEDVKLVLENKK